MKDDQGILPTIENLRTTFKDFMKDIQPLVEKSDEEHIDNLRQQLDTISQKVRVLPEQILKSYELIQLVIHSIHSSRSELKKSVDGLIKKTGQQLKRVTSTTEDATNKIMDTAEQLDARQDKILSIIKQMESGACEDNTSLFTDLRKLVADNRDSAFSIIDYLQFQDITAQQIAAAYALLADTEKTLVFVSNLLKRFDFDNDLMEDVQRLIDRNAFNADASFNDKANVQSAIDDLFKTGDVTTEIPEDMPTAGNTLDKLKSAAPASGEDFDIDALFAQNNAAPTAPAAPAPAAATDEDFDIDALFAQNSAAPAATAPAAPAEEEEELDIDALFAQNNNNEK